MELMIWGLVLYARYVAIVLILGATVAFAVWLFSAVAGLSNGRATSTKEPSD